MRPPRCLEPLTRWLPWPLHAQGLRVSRGGSPVDVGHTTYVFIIPFVMCQRTAPHPRAVPEVGGLTVRGPRVLRVLVLWL